MKGFTIEKKQRFEQECQKPFEVHNFCGFVILAQQSQQRPNEHEVLCIEISFEFNSNLFRFFNSMKTSDFKFSIRFLEKNHFLLQFI